MCVFYCHLFLVPLTSTSQSFSLVLNVTETCSRQFFLHCCSYFSLLLKVAPSFWLECSWSPSLAHEFEGSLRRVLLRIWVPTRSTIPRPRLLQHRWGCTTKLWWNLQQTISSVPFKLHVMPINYHLCYDQLSQKDNFKAEKIKIDLMQKSKCMARLISKENFSNCKIIIDLM